MHKRSKRNTALTLLLAPVIAIMTLSLACASEVSLDDHEAVQSQLEDQIQNADELNSALTQAQSEIEELQIQIDEAAIQQEATDQSKEAQSLLETQVEEADTEIAGLEDIVMEVQALNSALEIDRERAEALDARLSQATLELEALKVIAEEAETQKSELTAAQERMGNLETELDQTGEAISELQASMNQADALRVVLDSLTAWNRKDRENFLAGFEEDGISGLPAELLGGPAVTLRRIVDSSIHGDTASVHVMFALGTQRRSVLDTLVKEDGIWKSPRRSSCPRR